MVIDHRLLTSPKDKQVAERSLLIKNMLEDLGDAHLNQPIPIPNVSLPQAIQPKQYSPSDTERFLHPPFTLPRRFRMKWVLTMSLRSTRLYSEKSSSGASTIATTPLRLTTRIRTTVRRPPISTSGIRSLCRLTKRCSSRLSWYVHASLDIVRNHF